MVIFRAYRRTASLLIIIALALQLSALTAYASPLDDKRAELQNLNSQIQATKDQSNETARQQAEAGQQIQLSNQKLVGVQKKLNDLQISLNATLAGKKDAEIKLTGLQIKLEEAKTALGAAKDKLAKRRKILSGRLVSVYKSGESSFIVFILGSRSFDDLINRATFIGMIAAADNNLILSVKRLAATIANRVDLVAATKEAEDQQRRRFVAEENNIKTITAGIVAQENQLQADVVKQQQLYVQTQQKKDQLAVAQKQLQAGSAVVAGQISSLESGGNSGAVVAPSQLRDLAAGFAAKYGIPAKLFFALVTQESGWNYQATSSVGAIGLTQVMPYNVIANGYNLESFKNSPGDQLELGAKYLSMQYQTFGRWDWALAAYNAGPGAVLLYGGIPPYPETQNYVRNILAMAGMA